MFKKEMSIKEFISLPEIQTLIDEGMMTVNAVDEQEVEYEDDTQHLLDEINSTGMLKQKGHMVKKYNQYTLENYFKMLTIQTGRKNPCDIMEFLEEEYYSQSKKENVKYKDMDITHLIRVMLNASEDVETNREENDRLRLVIKNITNLIGGMNEVIN